MIADIENTTEETIKNLNTETNKKILEILYNWCLTYKKDNIREDFAQFMNKICRDNKSILRKTDIIKLYRNQLSTSNLTENIIFEKLICKKPSRSISGITSITLVMSPYPHGQTFSCEHNCYYCPNEPAHEKNNFQAQPRSYLFEEPAVRRANRHNFEAIGQMVDRMDCLYANGHTIDKLEIIVEGGTYTEYPIKYLEEFQRDTYYAANTYFGHKREKKSLDEEVRENRQTRVHIIGICIETRPDAIDSDWIYHFRKCGVTRIQLGIQSTHNHILKKINRGHTIEQGLECMEYLKNLCFKIDIHLMPDLPFTTPELDKQSFDYVYSVLQPDQMKIYPCVVVPWTIIEKWYKKGIWKPFDKEDLLDVMNYGVHNCPEWCRLPRVIRDIPNGYIEAGNLIPNLRQNLTESKDIRSREIERHPQYFNKPGKLIVRQYSPQDYFISWESLDEKALFGFIRLRLPIKYEKEYTVLHQKGLIRELHVYGFNTAVGDKAKSSQHIGIGTKLLKKAEKITYLNNFKGVVIISGEGVKEYYKKKGYHEKDTFMVKNFYITLYDVIICFILILIGGMIIYYQNNEILLIPVKVCLNNTKFGIGTNTMYY